MNQTLKQNQILVTAAEKDYELFDSGDGQKLERFGKFVLSRPDPQALWEKNLGGEEWAKADGIFDCVGDKDEDSDGKGNANNKKSMPSTTIGGETSSKNQSSSKGRWKLKSGTSEKWQINFAGLKFYIEPTPFKHVGLFPEQKGNWEWVREQVKRQKAKGKSKDAVSVIPASRSEAEAKAGILSNNRVSNADSSKKNLESGVTQDPRFRGNDKKSNDSSYNPTTLQPSYPEILNLFGYTGGASLACASAGASVVHVDGSKVSIKRAKDNAELSGLADKPIRWILDDARDFVKRELRRGKKYHGIIMDPPSFGRGDKGQVWKIEEDFIPLFNDCLKLLSDKPLLFLINGYAAGYSPIAYANNLEILKNKFGGTIEAGELAIEEKESRGSNGGNGPHTRLLPCGIFARWTR